MSLFSTYVRTFSLHKLRKNCHFLDHPPTPMFLRNINTLGWAPRNLSCLEFKFDDTRLSYWHKNKIGRIEFFFLLLPDFANSLLCWLSQQNWANQQGRKLVRKVRKQLKKFQFYQSYSYVHRKVWYHQIWIPNNLDFIVSDLLYMAD